MSGWSPAKNERRCELIDKSEAGTATEVDLYELESLQDQMLADGGTRPLPIEEVTALHDALKQQVPKQPHESKLFWTGLAMLVLGLFEVGHAIAVERGYPGAAETLTAAGGLLTIIFRRYTDRPFRFTRRH